MILNISNWNSKLAVVYKFYIINCATTFKAKGCCLLFYFIINLTLD